MNVTIISLLRSLFALLKKQFFTYITPSTNFFTPFLWQKFRHQILKRSIYYVALLTPRIQNASQTFLNICPLFGYQFTFDHPLIAYDSALTLSTKLTNISNSEKKTFSKMILYFKQAALKSLR